MSNCVVRSCGSRLPCSVVADHGIEGSDRLSHDGDDNDFGFLVGRGETVVEDFKDGVVPSCAEGSHVEDVTDRHAATAPPRRGMNSCRLIRSPRRRGQLSLVAR